jgi:transcriptional regulator with GAF, ATPase, and Fis domain
VNSAAIPKDLVESVLFGHKKGAFTGAISDQTGVFDRADHGTLFLDEIGELPVSSQAKLLRVLEDGLVEPIGDKKTHKVDARIIAATNQDLGRAIKRGLFREDLFTDSVLRDTAAP